MSRPARIAAAALLALAVNSQAQVSGIPTGDIAVWREAATTTQENIKRTLKQVEQHRTQLQQYAQQIKDSVAPAAYIWDQASRSINMLREAMWTLEFYKRQMGDINFYLRQFNDVGDYRSSPCFGGNSCTKEQRDQETARQASVLDAQKRANEAAIRAVDQQQEALISDARNLERLQRSAQTAQGQREAIDAATQVASHQSNQLLQIRGILIAQNAALVTRQQVLADREAREAAASEEFRRGTFIPSPKREW